MIYPIYINEKPLFTPKKRALAVPSAALADAIRNEWQNLPRTPKPQDLPFTQFSNTALDLVADDRCSVVQEWCKFLHTDITCYLADTPPELTERQQKIWTPLRQWFETQCGHALRTTTELLPITQPDIVMDESKKLLIEFSDFQLAALQTLAGLLGSAVLSLAVVKRIISADEALSACLIEEVYQSERWGEPEEMTKSRDTLIRAVKEADEFLSLL